MKLDEKKKIRFYLEDIGFKEINYYSKVDTYKYIFDDGDYNVEGDRKNKKAVKFYTFDELRAYLES